MKSPYFCNAHSRNGEVCPLFLEGLPWDFCAPGAGTVIISATRIHQARRCALTGHVRDMETESAGDWLMGAQGLWQSREPNVSLGMQHSPHVPHAGHNSLSSMNH